MFGTGNLCKQLKVLFAISTILCISIFVLLDKKKKQHFKVLVCEINLTRIVLIRFDSRFATNVTTTSVIKDSAIPEHADRSFSETVVTVYQAAPSSN